MCFAFWTFTRCVLRLADDFNTFATLFRVCMTFTPLSTPLNNARAMASAPQAAGGCPCRIKTQLRRRRPPVEQNPPNMSTFVRYCGTPPSCERASGPALAASSSHEPWRSAVCVLVLLAACTRQKGHLSMNVHRHALSTGGPARKQAVRRTDIIRPERALR